MDRELWGNRCSDGRSDGSPVGGPVVFEILAPTTAAYLSAAARGRDRLLDALRIRKGLHDD